ncbi:3,4-dioxygenase subunit beta [Actinoplanes couchii]|uniref:3,4-dioxygenase subunit beta n=1 Tax=Actinoplanes couchii TaxID=403638 RepID=A0ABQ3XCP2_9ACTN|nr:3,4-dioxygenase subunit beta [Actinoplanes couchii]MDR6321145.1 protocatechuate 3,4-dioxygenase beta subunit [Actinoplanes couchii]GID56254.1 3,4-dioxygenase subunit beta [Actinoplanes couchii]
MITYEGRELPKPGEEVFDQGLGFDLGTMRRRQVLRAFGLGAVAFGLSGCGDTDSTTTPSATSATTSTLQEIPDETAGPYPGDGSNGPNVLTESGVVRSDIRSSFGSASGKADGVPMTITLNIKDLTRSAAAFAGVAVYAWHCDRDGNYSLYSTGITGENYLRGVQVADDTGAVTFTSIFPACYSGRWPHVHFEVYTDQASITSSSNAIATSQVALPKDVCDEVYKQTGYEKSVTNLAQVSLDSDNVFGEDSGELQLATVTGNVSSGFAVSLDVGVDTTTTPSGGGDAPSGGGGPSGGPGGAPPSGGPGGAPPSGGPGPGGAPPSR